MKCEAGCKAFTGGEIRHHPDCGFYPESLSKMLDEAEAQLAESNDLLVEANSCFDQAVSIIEKLRKVVPKLVEVAEGGIKQ